MSVQNNTCRPYFLRAAEGEAVWFMAANRMTLKATSESTGGALSLIEALLAPGFAPVARPPLRGRNDVRA